MKVLKIFLFIIIVTLLLCGCATDQTKNNSYSTSDETQEVEKLNYVEITDGDTNAPVSFFYLTDDQSSKRKLNILVDAYNYKKKTKDKLTKTPDYIVHEANVDKPYCDNWYNVYVSNNKLYIQDIVKKEAYSEDLNVTSDIYECLKVNTDDFMELLIDSDENRVVETVTNTSIDFTSEVNNDVSYFDVLDYKTREKISKITADSSKESMAIMDLYNFYTLVDYDLNLDAPNYTIHYVTDGNSQNDVWFDVYLVGEIIYTKCLPVKGTRFEKSDKTNEIHRADTITSAELLKIITDNY